MLSPHFKKHYAKHDTLVANVTNNVTVPYFTSTQLSAIYNYPSVPTAPNVIGVISFGGGLMGTVSPEGILTNGDVQKHWTYLGISPANFPKVIIVTLLGATNNPNPADGATIENTIDVETIGAMYPSANLTIILYISPNSLAAFTTLLTKVSTVITVNNVQYKPSIISCSWGAPESYYPTSLLSSINAQLQALAQSGVNVTVATGDNGSSDGTGSSMVDFPSSSPWVVACGGTHLVCPTGTYGGNQTSESAWSSGGGGISKTFAKPSYQSAINATGRCTPDISQVADPNTGVLYTISGELQVIGGTSIVAPAVAAFIGLVNYKQFLNPSLYSYPAYNFHDIISGGNGAFFAKPGYDNCTGLGSFVGTALATSLIGVPVDVSGITLNMTLISMNVAASFQLVPTITPVGATNKTVTYTTSNNAIVQVSGTGLIYANSPGTAIVTVTTNNGKTAIVNVTVTQFPASVSLSPSVATLLIGQSISLVTTVLPPSTANKSVTWTSSNNSVATVDVSGRVVAVNGGTALITATTIVGGVRGSSTITVSIPVTGLRITPSVLVFKKGSSYTLTPIITPTNATNQSVTWSSNQPNVVSVNSSGVIRALNKGSATITGTINGLRATVSVTVN